MDWDAINPLSDTFFFWTQWLKFKIVTFFFWEKFKIVTLNLSHSLTPIVSGIIPIVIDLNFHKIKEKKLKKKKKKEEQLYVVWSASTKHKTKNSTTTSLNNYAQRKRCFLSKTLDCFFSFPLAGSCQYYSIYKVEVENQVFTSHGD